MGETENTSKLADRISEEIFKTFYWDRIGAKNTNWECVQQEKHHRKTHPSDIVFYYLSPYKNERIYINFDLKSYKDTTIKIKKNMVNAINNLSDSIECANNSEDWINRFTIKDHFTTKVYGSLFVHNNNREYKEDFYSMVKTYDEIKIANGVKLFIFSPEKINNLYSVSQDIQKLTINKPNNILYNKKYSFYYPDLENRKKIILSNTVPATIESFFEPWLILEYYQPDEKTDYTEIPVIEGYIIYYFEKGDTIEEFEYLIDYLSTYQLVLNKSQINIRGVNTVNLASSNWELAKKTYGAKYDNINSFLKKFDNTSFKTIDTTISKLTDIEIGLEE